MTESTADWIRVKDLFNATFEADAPGRIKALSAESDAQVRRRVESMLAAHDSENGLLDKSVLLSLDALDTSLVAPTPSLEGRMLGVYRVVREIARGGMGAVYEAERADSQFEQRVAIKTLRFGAESDAVRRRFVQERRILAALKHPNIATLYDGAITTEGLPYFVLEFIDGVSIESYCRDRKLSLRERIELFLQVIAAVQYAHQQLVVHRDIKPGNILVTADGNVKLLDFGIAKLLDDSGDENTKDLIAPLTLNYASPEQVTGAPITAASDVYSLGVVLYRLVTCANPLELEGLPLESAITTLSTVTPRAPSDAVSQECADSMRVDSTERLRKNLRGDLDAILMTALRKEPDRRYATARQFGDDLECYLKGHPVSAVRDSLAYRLGKFVRRQRALVAASLIAAIAVIGGGAGTLWQARQTRIEAARAKSVSSFLQSIIGAGDMSSASSSPRLGPTGTVAQLLDSAANRLPYEFANDPEARVSIHLTLGQSYLTQQRWRPATLQFESARNLSESLPHQPRVETATALAGLASIQLLSGGPLPRDLTQQALEILDKRSAQQTSQYADVLRLAGILDAVEGSYARADTLLGKSVRLFQSLDPKPSLAKASALVDHTAVGEATGRPWAASLADYRRALAMIDSIPGNFSDKADVLWYAARAEGIAGNQPKADSLGKAALNVLELAVGPHSGAVAQQLAQMAAIKRLRGDTVSARDYVQRAVAIIDNDKEVPALIKERVLMEYSLYKLGRGDIAAADSLAAVVYNERVATGNWVYVLDAANQYTLILVKEKKYAAATPILRNAIDMATRAKSTGYQALFEKRLKEIVAK